MGLDAFFSGRKRAETERRLNFGRGQARAEIVLAPEARLSAQSANVAIFPQRTGVVRFASNDDNGFVDKSNTRLAWDLSFPPERRRYIGWGIIGAFTVIGLVGAAATVGQAVLIPVIIVGAAVVGTVIVFRVVNKIISEVSGVWLNRPRRRR